MLPEQATEEFGNYLPVLIFINYSIEVCNRIADRLRQVGCRQVYTFADFVASWPQTLIPLLREDKKEVLLST